MLHAINGHVNKESIAELCEQLDDLHEENERLQIAVNRLEKLLLDRDIQILWASFERGIHTRYGLPLALNPSH